MLHRISRFPQALSRNLLIATLQLSALLAPYTSLAFSTSKELHHSINRWPHNSKLSQPTVLSILSDRWNALWILTLDGISRFDGTYLTDFRHYHTGKGFIPSSMVTQLIQDSSGEIYAITRDAGILIYDPVEQQFFSMRSDNGNLLKNAEISSGFADSKGFIWIGSKTGQIFRAKPSLGLIEEIHLPITEEIVDFTQNNAGAVFALTKQGNVIHVFNSKVELKSVINHCASSGMEASAITALNGGSLWIGTRGNGLYKANLQNTSCHKVELPSSERLNNDQPIIHDILHSDYSNLTWITTSKGIFRIENEEQIIRYDTKNSSISDDWVIAIAESDAGTFWIGTYDGLNYIIPTHFQIFGTGQSSEIHSVVGIDSRDNKGAWIAMYNGLQYLDFEAKSHSDPNSLLEFSKLKNNQIMSLNVNREGIWIGYHSSGLEHYSFTNGENKYYGVNEKSKLSSNAITKIVTSITGEVLVGTYGGGLNIIFKDGTTKSISVGDNKVIMLHETKKGPVLIGTESGLFSYDFDSSKLLKVNFDYSNYSFFSEPLIWSIGESENGDLWLGSKLQGLFLWRMDRLTGKYPDELIHITQHLKDLTIYAIELDDKRKIWMSTNSGLSSYDPFTNEHQTYSILYGLHETKFDHGVSHKDSMGNLYFGGNSGYVRFKPSLIEYKNLPPKISLTKIESVSNPAGFNLSSTLKANLIQLTHKDYLVKFTFSVLDFLDPDKNQYRYKLEGFDPQWIDNGTRNTATYTNLPAGKYTLRVQGANSSGIWNREGLALHVEVLPAWWWTWWAYTFYVLLCAFGVWLLMRWYHTYRVKEDALERADSMHEAALRSEDDLQEQYELQDRLLQSVYHHNTSTLKLVNDCISSQSQIISDHIYREAVENSVRRVDALAVLEGCMYYQGDEILADLKNYVDKIIPLMLMNAPVRAETVSTINDISPRLLPVALASPLAIIIFEILENSLQHAFEPGSLANYIHLVSKTERSNSEDPAELYDLNIRDSGLGIPGNIDLNALETSGLVNVQSLVARLSGKLQIFAEGGTTISVVIPIPEV